MASGFVKFRFKLLALRRFIGRAIHLIFPVRLFVRFVKMADGATLAQGEAGMGVTG